MTERASGWGDVCPACKGYPDQAHTCEEAMTFLTGDWATIRTALDTLTSVSLKEDVDDAALHEDSLNAYDALSRLRDEVEKLREERDAAQAGWQEAEHPFDKSEYDAMFDRMQAAEAEVEKQGEALRLLREVMPYLSTGDSLVSRHFVLQGLHHRAIELFDLPDPGDFVPSGYWGDLPRPETADERGY